MLKLITMTVKYVLSSGNFYFFFPENSNKIAYGFFCTPNNVFLGGVLDKEAVRKARTFEQLGCQKEICVIPELSELDYNEFSDKLGSASRYFKMSINMWISDYTDCDGTGSSARSCDERRYYYMAAGLQNCYNSRKRFPLVLFIANHISIFSVKNFRETFFSGSEGFESDSRICDRKTRYFHGEFKAPAFYVRAVIQNT